MASELFLMPMIGTGASRDDPFRAKYANTTGVTNSASIRYGRTDDCIAIITADAATLTTIRNDPDVTSLATPANADVALTAAQANAAKTVFEGKLIPNLVVNVGDTRRQVIRGIVGVFLFSQRMEGIAGEGWKKRAVDAGITLDTQWADFPAVLKTSLQEVAASFSWDIPSLGLTNQATMRQILKTISEQFEQTPIFIGGVEI